MTREHRAPGDDRPARGAVSRRPDPPGPPPEREHGRRGRDPQPRDAEHVAPARTAARRRPARGSGRRRCRRSRRGAARRERRTRFRSPVRIAVLFRFESKGLGRAWQRRTTADHDLRLRRHGRRLIAELQEDARLSIAELGRRVSLSPPAVAERAPPPRARRRHHGLPRRNRPEALGYTLGAIMRVRPTARQLPKVAELARETPEVVECHRITGEDCFFMKLHVRDVGHLEEVSTASCSTARRRHRSSSRRPSARRGPRVE